MTEDLPESGRSARQQETHIIPKLYRIIAVQIEQGAEVVQVDVQIDVQVDLSGIAKYPPWSPIVT